MFRPPLRVRRAAAPKPDPQPVPASNDEIDAFREDARWLLEWHNKRSDGFGSRCVALLGFTGVILALLPRGLDLNGHIHTTVGIRSSLIATAVLLLATAGCCLFTLAPQNSSAPGIEELRKGWRDYADGQHGPRPQAQVTERLLHGRSDQPSPLHLAQREADRRGRWFSAAVTSMGLALLALTSLVIQLFAQV